MPTVGDVLTHHPHVFERRLSKADDQLRLVERRIRSTRIAGVASQKPIGVACLNRSVGEDRQKVRLSIRGRRREVDEERGEVGPSMEEARDLDAHALPPERSTRPRPPAAPPGS